jgi:hypothetical protein
MIKPVPTACTLICDNCRREFNHDKRHVFKTQNQAMALAEQRGWDVNFHNGHAICPECDAISRAKYGVREVREALANISRTYSPQVGQQDNKEKIQDMLARELKAHTSDSDLLWKICTEYNLVWYDEYSGIYKINL